MKFSLSEGKIVIRFTLNFIIHQFLMLSFSGVPAAIFLTIFNGSTSEPAYTGVVAMLSFLFYIVYCVFYGYYVAFPMLGIILRVRQLAKGDYLISQKSKTFNPAKRLYREVYANLDMLAKTLKENQNKREEFEKQRQEWAAGVTHDLKTPLSYIAGYTEMLLSKDHKWSDEEKEEFLQIIRNKSKYMEELIGDLGVVFRMDNDQFMLPYMESIELTEFLRRILAEIASLPDTKEDSFEIIDDKKPIIIYGDKKLLHRAFTNLLVNAIAHNPARTKITVKIRSYPQLIIEISDNGKGLSEFDKKNLFNRYFRGSSTEEHEGGTGLGMAIVKQIITAHKGTISVESKLKSGTTFTIYLPSKAEG
ncbi:sensor histidine kinase [Enterococcus columbae]|uniref:histidine kinase n=1 Tax=Enterococcus columbae DSM 7374 = ATCC 51263 TaxID=1121865 RepID=S1NWJ5_9ENTE|nr:HAMP domain-containing sensor histidine kinase [Enterococcus columbae]EOT44388.1 hypothetical protein OMW_00444 [Enterococcus columbae DSM 7374 = ATCC 51263]EOW84546.1 hypothetical protein I568_01042 [Enterococcus columbae DSM 7374 = ATCC 51263]